MAMKSLFLGGSLAALGASPAWAQTWTGHEWMWRWGGGGMFGGGLAMILFWAVIILLIVLVVRGLSGGSAPRASAPPENSALRILQERFARGEIDKQEFEDRRKTLAG